MRDAVCLLVLASALTLHCGARSEIDPVGSINVEIPTPIVEPSGDTRTIDAREPDDVTAMDAVADSVVAMDATSDVDASPSDVSTLDRIVVTPDVVLRDVVHEPLRVDGAIVECDPTVGNIGPQCIRHYGLVGQVEGRIGFRCCNGRCESGSCPTPETGGVAQCNGPCDLRAGQLCCRIGDRTACLPRDRGLCR